MRRHLAEKVDVQGGGASRAARDAQRPGAQSHEARARDRVSRAGAERGGPPGAGGHALAPARRAPRARVRPRGDLLSARERLRGKLSYTNLGFALAPPTFTLAELRDLYAAALGHTVSATEPAAASCCGAGCSRTPASGGTTAPAAGRPATIYRFAPAGWRSRTSSPSSGRLQWLTEWQRAPRLSRSRSGSMPARGSPSCSASWPPA
jgi:8-oxo-dGTP diphosphatase